MMLHLLPEIAEVGLYTAEGQISIFPSRNKGGKFPDPKFHTFILYQVDFTICPSN